MRQPYYPIRHGDIRYYRLTSESDLVGRDDKTWHTTGCRGRRAAEDYMADLWQRPGDGRISSTCARR